MFQALGKDIARSTSLMHTRTSRTGRRPWYPLLTVSAMFVSVASASVAQLQAPAAVVSTNPIDVRTAADIDRQAHALLEEARKRPDGAVSVTLERYPGHFTMLAAWAKPGGAELHQHFSDIFIALDGEATEVVGGTIENARESASGEVRGTRVVGGTEHPMHKGDVIHIAPNTPHQTVVADGKYFLYYVVKVQATDPATNPAR